MNTICRKSIQEISVFKLNETAERFQLGNSNLKSLLVPGAKSECNEPAKAIAVNQAV